MFDLFKDIDRYKGITPYASEHYGVYQPLLGWESRLTKKWIQRGGSLIDPRMKRILDGRLLPGPLEVQHDHPLEFLAQPLLPGSGKFPYKVVILKDLNSEVLKQIQIILHTFVDHNGGRLPEGEEWTQVIDINNFLDPENGLMRKVNDILRTRLNQEMDAQSPGRFQPGAGGCSAQNASRAYAVRIANCHFFAGSS